MAQVFPLVSHIATEGQVDATIRAVHHYLRDKRFWGIRLNTDFDALQPHLGCAFSFAYGEKEKGAVFSHVAVMYAYALYVRRQAEEGRAVWYALYRMATDQQIGRIFPGVPEDFNVQGLGLYCYLAGSASWLIYLLVTQAFGVRGELGDLVIDPQLTLADFGSRTALRLATRFADRSLQITFENPQRLRPGAYGVTTCRYDSSELSLTRLARGGRRIARRTIEQFSTHQPIPLHVTLAPPVM